MTKSLWMWGTGAERWQKEPRYFTHSNLGRPGEFLPPPLGVISRLLGQAQRYPNTGSSATKEGQWERQRGPGGQPRGCGHSPGRGDLSRHGSWPGGVGSERHQGPLTLLWDSGVVLHREALHLFPRWAHMTPGFTRAGQHPLRPESVT